MYAAAHRKLVMWQSVRMTSQWRHLWRASSPSACLAIGECVINVVNANL